ncbi:c-type cytochrome [Thiomonas bhubaneswarensis]|uniref:Cytochrome c553 n=1 Tax=Thiomonas bhubaneswarensis TaxID=339866 RepID=A0A0K6I7F2_9BURK|nr:cytochrome c [Thiomonas bhubaneswarensis]CUA98988.1 Cytochrome c553 [Thiomonas bhubaneswarensis]
MKRLFAALLVAALPVISTAAHAADIKKGEDLVNKGGCIACHGAGLDKPIAPNYPKLAGQYQSYLFHALQQYQTKHQTPLYGRNNPIMGGIVAQYNRQDLEDIAAYIASLKGDLYIRDEMH